MNLISDFIKNNDVDIVENKLEENELKQLFSAISFYPGAQFIEFVKKFSYLAYGPVEFFGINIELMENSYLFKTTKALIEKYETVKGYYVVEACGDGYYVLVDAEDNIYNFFVGDSESPEPVGEKFYNYILMRFEESDL